MTFRLPTLVAAALMLIGGLTTQVQASTVDASNSVSFEFDLSTTNAATFLSFGFSCGGCIGEDRLLSGATMELDFGSSAGASDLGTAHFTNPFGFAINNVSAGLSPQPVIPAAISSLFVTFKFVDDAYGVTNASLYSSETGMIRNISATDVPVAPVPLPAAMVLLATGLGALGFAARK